jgi:hypothetical protein
VQRSIEVLIGRLITDEDFRRLFVRDPHGVLLEAGDWGFSLSQSEIAAFVATDASLWDQVADLVDPRLQKASLSRETDWNRK